MARGLLAPGRTVRHIACALLGAGLGGAAVLAVVRRDGSPPRAAASAAPASDTPQVLPTPVLLGPVQATLGDDEKNAIRALIRDELRSAAVSQHPDAGPPPSADEVLARLPPEQQAKYESAMGLVRDGIARRRWTHEDKANLHEALGAVPDELRFSVMSEIIAAVNRGDVTYEGRGPLF